MLTCATLPSINLYWCSSPTWKPFYWPSASPAWSSRQLLIYAEYWVCSSSPFGLHFYLSLLCDLRSKMNPPTIPLISHPVLPKTSEDLKNCPCWSLQTMHRTKKRRKTRTHGKISGTLTCSAGRREPQVHRERQNFPLQTYHNRYLQHFSKELFIL